MFGAIAYHYQNNQRWSGQDKCSSRSEAEEAALNEAGGGVILAWAENSYMALAMSAIGHAGGGFGDSENAATQMAISQCENNGGTDCYIVCTFYTG